MPDRVALFLIVAAGAVALMVLAGLIGRRTKTERPKTLLGARWSGDGYQKAEIVLGYAGLAVFLLNALAFFLLP
jgi:hypothetical protein